MHLFAVYSNSLMATFNSRKSHTESAPPSLEVSSYALSNFGAASNPTMRGASAGSAGVIVHREVRVLQYSGSNLGSSGCGAIFIKETRSSL